METRPAGPQAEELEGYDDTPGSWGDYPIDELLIRNETRTIQGAVQRIERGTYVMDPDFQRDFIWPEEKQSKLMESVMMRIPLPVFYMAEDNQGQMVVVDGLQRLSTFQRFVKGELELQLPNRSDLHRKRFSDLSPKLRNRIEDCNLIFYIIDSKVPERARLDILERVNGGVPLTRQQMRNCLYMGQATRFLKDESHTEIFLKATGKSLKRSTMRDREFVNRFCAFRILDLAEYLGDMDEFLASCLRKMNKMTEDDLSLLSGEFHRGLANNFVLFDRHAFRKHVPGQDRRSTLNASFWDVMSTGLSRYTEERVRVCAEPLRKSIYRLLDDEEFNISISYGPNDPKKVRHRFRVTRQKLEEILDVGRYIPRQREWSSR